MISIKKKDLEAHLQMKQIHLQTKRMDGYAEGWSDWEVLGRCYYYLRDPRATDYLRRAADAMAIVAHSSMMMLHRANLYFMAGDHSNTQRVVNELHALGPDRFWRPDEQRPFLFFQACGAFLSGDYDTCIKYREPFLNLFAPNDHPPYAAWVMDLASAQITKNHNLAQDIAQHLIQVIKHSNDKPWDTAIINHWDWYERATILVESIT